MSIDLSGLSAKELASLIRDAQKRKTVVSKRQPITKVRAQLVKAAQKAGYSIDELFGAGAPRATAHRVRQGREEPQQGHQDRPEVSRPGQCRQYLDRPWQAAALAGRIHRQRPQGRGFPDPEVIRGIPR